MKEPSAAVTRMNLPLVGPSDGSSKTRRLPARLGGRRVRTMPAVSRAVGSNSTGHNAFFVRSDVAGELPALEAAEGWVESRLREGRDRRGKFGYVDTHRERRALMPEMPLIDGRSGERLTVADLDSQ